MRACGCYGDGRAVGPGLRPPGSPGAGLGWAALLQAGLPVAGRVGCCVGGRLGVRRRAAGPSPSPGLGGPPSAAAAPADGRSCGFPCLPGMGPALRRGHSHARVRRGLAPLPVAGPWRGCTDGGRSLRLRWPCLTGMVSTELGALSACPERGSLFKDDKPAKPLLFLKIYSRNYSKQVIFRHLSAVVSAVLLVHLFYSQNVFSSLCTHLSS